MQILFNMADLAVLGKCVDYIALGSVGSATILVTMFTSLIIGIASGINVITAQKIGAGKAMDISRTVYTAFVVSIICGIIIFFIAEIVGPMVLKLLGTKKELYSGAILYIRIYFIFIINFFDNF